MARIEKTVFISYRRTDVFTALAVYESLKNQGYNVFFDYRSISSGDFEQIITSNIRARAHFVLILTSTALDRCNEPGDWLRREIEIAIDEKRNIVPLFFKGFRFGTPSVSETLTGKLRNLSRYNGLNVHEDYFEEAMQRLRNEFLNVPLNTVLHPVSNTVQKIVREEQVAADKALEQIEDVQNLVKGTEVNLNTSKGESDLKPVENSKEKQREEKKIKLPPIVQPFHSPPKKMVLLNPKLRLFLGVASLLIGVPLCIMFGANYAINNVFEFVTVTVTSSPTNAISTTFTHQTTSTVAPSLTEAFISPAPTLGIGSSMVSEKDDMTLLYVPAGEFTMGSDSGGNDEKPVHTVTLDAFWIDQTEVTNKMYSLCESAGVCKEPAYTGSLSRSSYYGNAEYDNYPVVYVDWNSANSYCKWVDRRLPTEAEWEKAASWDAKNQTKNVYPWGDFIDCSFANYYGGRACVGDTTKVGSYESGQSPYGVYDMAGNVWEWVADWYDESYYSTLREIVRNPQGPPIGQHRVLRGGSWYYSDVASYIGSGIPSADRSRIDPLRTSSNIGFRCAMSTTP